MQYLVLSNFGSEVPGVFDTSPIGVFSSLEKAFIKIEWNTSLLDGINYEKIIRFDFFKIETDVGVNERPFISFSKVGKNIIIHSGKEEVQKYLKIKKVE